MFSTKPRGLRAFDISRRIRPAVSNVDGHRLGNGLDHADGGVGHSAPPIASATRLHSRRCAVGDATPFHVAAGARADDAGETTGRLWLRRRNQVGIGSLVRAEVCQPARDSPGGAPAGER